LLYLADNIANGMMLAAWVGWMGEDVFQGICSAISSTFPDTGCAEDFSLNFFPFVVCIIYDGSDMERWRTYVWW
ncbi:TPA: hypothetical protein ACQVH3_005149, partial [Serratia marcescens]